MNTRRVVPCRTVAGTLNTNSLVRILIVCPSWVGDTVMATPFLRALRGIPGSERLQITGYMRPGLKEILAGEASNGQPLLDEFIVGRPTGWVGPWREGRRLAGRGFDALILLPNSGRLAIMAMVARIPVRFGYNRDGRGWMLTHPIACPVPGGWKEPVPAIDYYLHLASQLGVPALEDRQPMLSASTQQDESARAILTGADINLDTDRIALLNPGANSKAKRWPVDRFARLARHLAKTHDMRIVVNGSPSEVDLTTALCAQADCGALNLATGRATLGTLKAICGLCAIVVTNDTGTRHIAVAMACATARMDRRRPAVVTLFGPVNPAWTKLGYEREIELVGQAGRVDAITFDEVRSAADTLLAGASTDEVAR